MVTQKGKVWYVRLETKDAAGDRKQKWIKLPGVTSKREAEREEARLKTEQATGLWMEPSKLTVGEFVTQWLEGLKVSVSGRTWETYRDRAKCHILPHLGQIPLAKLSPADIRGWQVRLLTSGGKDGKGLAHSTVFQTHAVLKHAMKQAVRDSVLARNPVDAVRPPRAERHQWEPLNQEETRELLERVRGERHFLVIFLAAMTGMRRNELLGLRFEDVDFDAGVVHVRQAMEETEDGIRFKEPKTNSSRRSIRLPLVAIEELRRYRAETGRVYGLLFTQADGVSPLNPRKFSDYFNRLLKRVGIRHIRLHDLRHGMATELFRAGFHPKMVSSRLGHSKVSITLDIYSHVLPGMDDGIAAHLDTAFLPNRAETGS